MDTLDHLMEQLGIDAIFNPIKSMYSTRDHTTTLKLLLRCKIIYEAKEQLLVLFWLIFDFEWLSEMIFEEMKGEVLSLKFHDNTKEFETVMKSLLESLVSFLKKNPQLGRKQFIFRKQEYLWYSIGEYLTIRKALETRGLKPLKSLKSLDNN